MIPSDIRLYTWVDVEEVLLNVQENHQWPKWLIRAQAYWDNLRLGVSPGSKSIAIEWLKDIFDPRFEFNKNDYFIILESISKRRVRKLSILIEETSEEPSKHKFIPTLSRPSILGPDKIDEPPKIFENNIPPIVVFHSFKGGVGRTIHAIALAQALSKNKNKVLLIDGDLEAPGISWLLKNRLPNPPIAFADLLALVHGDTDEKAKKSISLVVERIRGAQIDGIYILPSFRSSKQFTSLEIRPEHLIKTASDPFILTRLLGDLGRALNVDAVLVDLRAGLSELATGLILDPRVYRILISTLSGQSIAGTIQLLDIMGRLAPSTREQDPIPALILSQVSDEYQKSDLLFDLEQQLLEAAKDFLKDDNRDLLRITSPFNTELSVLPTSWEEVLNKIQLSGLNDIILPLINWLPIKIYETDKIKLNILTLRNQRELLRDKTKKLVFAESGEDEDFLATTPLRHLASDNQRQVPISVVVGAKGSGKTYTFLQVIRRQNWRTFVKDTLASPQIDAFICPILESRNLKDRALNLIKEVKTYTAKQLNLENKHAIDIRDYIRNKLTEKMHESQWREYWLNLFAWNIGFQINKETAGRDLIKYLLNNNNKLVFVIDGLEDLFQDIITNESQQTALRSLLQEIPDWLGQQPGRPIGIIIFVRRDMVIASIRQNPAQLMARYEPYALKWNPEEALRLVAWVTTKATGFPKLNIDQLQDMSEQDLVHKLIILWGKKLGHDNSREARSAEWVIAALSDFKGQIQARDLVRFLHIAAKKSTDDSYWSDRFLVPPAIRAALAECSREKIEEIETENQTLREIFTNLRNLAIEKQIPFIREDIKLNQEEMKILEENGVVIREKDEYYMPEIFRWGLGFTLKSGVRPRVLTLARRASKI